MSGCAGATKNCEWFRISINSQLSECVAIPDDPDDSVFGPEEYFENEEKGYLDRIDKLESELTKFLMKIAEQDSVQLLPFDSSLPAVNHSVAVPCNINFFFSLKNCTDDVCLTISVSKPVTTEARKYIRDETERLMRLDTVPF